eukprot:a841389_1445.p1 GENE.a841389_1445~~a841389_1445.p1  ORF type:complete len:159 (-),score=62.12 a841389_1445:176-601(-)
MSVNDADWRPVVLTKRGAKGKADVAAAERSGSAVAVRKAAVTLTSTGVDARKVDAAEDAQPIAHVDLSVARKIQQARNAKGMTQKQLAAAICERVQVVNELESGRGVPNNAVLGKLERALGVKLRGGAKKKKAAAAAESDD